MRLVIHDYSGYAFPVELSRELARRGHEVLHHYFSDFQAPKGPLLPRPDDPPGFAVAGLDIGEPFAKHSLIKRQLQERRFGATALRAARAFRPDVFVASNMPLDPLGILQAGLQADGCRFVLWWQDIYSVAMGKLLPRRLPVAGHLVAAHYRRLERRVCRQADAIVCITDDFLPILDDWQVPRTKATTIENWAPLHEIRPVSGANAWAAAHDLLDRPVLLYAGTLGLKHDPGLLWQAALHLAATPGMQHARVVVVSEGLGADWLRARLAERPDAPLVVLPFQPHERFNEVLATATVVTAVLEPAAGVFSVPSKVLSYLAAGKPILLAAPAENLASRTVVRVGAGAVVDPGDATAFARTAAAMLQHPADLVEMGARGRRHAESAFDIQRIADRFEHLWDAPAERRDAA
jgi:glycosyltransferase involved in cell wall biosynthesis